jgi:cyclophilin family peptidyl-prolyl cis-trans isomerase
MKRVIVIALLAAIVGGVDLGAQAARGRGAASPLPVVVFQTSKGNFEMELYPAEAPKSVEHILTLVRRGFYKGLRVHRFVEGFVVQFGDPQSRDLTKRDRWGAQGSGRPIGVAEISPKHPHKLGAVGLAHSGDPTGADSQIYFCLNGPARYAPPNAALNGKYAVIGQVTSGMDVVQKLRELDVINGATVKEPGRGAK